MKTFKASTLIFKKRQPFRMEDKSNFSKLNVLGWTQSTILIFEKHRKSDGRYISSLPIAAELFSSS